MTSPAAGQLHTVVPPPQNDPTVRQVADVLVLGGSIFALTAALLVILRARGIGRQAVMAALGLTADHTNPRPNARLKGAGLARGGLGARISRSVADVESYYRAAYVIAAAARIQAAIDAGQPVTVAVDLEKHNAAAHAAARKRRLDAASRVGKSAELYGPLLGWNLDPTLNNEIECITADGNNFYADQPPLIGYPGLVHDRCGCYPGPPHEGGGMVDAATRGVIRFGSARKVKLRAVKSA